LDSTPGAAALAEAELAQFHTLYEEYEMNLLRENDAPMSLKICTMSWYPIIGLLVRRKLDQYTLAALEDSANSPTEVLLLESVLAFLERRSGMLEALDTQPMGHTQTLVSRDSICKIFNIGSP